MPKKNANRVIRTNLYEHPAIQFWRTIQPKSDEPTVIEILKEARHKKNSNKKKSAVYRLKGIYGNGSAVIAKRCLRNAAAIERTIYQEILPRLPVPTLDYYGFLEEPDSNYCWLFVEDAAGQDYSPHKSEHRSAAGRFLGLLHASATSIDATARLPDRGPQYYLDQLRAAANTILRNLDNPALTGNDIMILRKILAQYELLESRWGEVKALCDNIPKTLVHGDFVAKNMYVRTSEEGVRVFPFDWEMAGWGAMIADLAQSPPSSTRFSANPDITVYWAMVRDFWPGVELQTLRYLAKFGTLFRLLVSIEWAAQSLAYEWIQGTMSRMNVYESRLANAIRVVDLGS